MLDKMAFFVYVIRSGSISSAARRFNISVSAGSRWLQELENHFGTTLCRRSNRLLEATQAGQTLFEEFSPLVDSAERISRKARRLPVTRKRPYRHRLHACLCQSLFDGYDCPILQGSPRRDI